MKSLNIFSLLFFTLWFSVAAPASEPNNLPILEKETVAARIVELIEDQSLLPHDIIKESDRYITLSRQNGWQDNLLAAITIKVEVLILLENLTDANKLVTEFYPVAVKNGDEEYIVRLELARLTIADAKGFSKALVDEQLRLQQKAEQLIEPIHQGVVYLGVGQSQYVVDNLAGALVNFKKAYDICAELDDSVLKSDVLNSLASIYVDTGDALTAIKYIQEAVEIKKALGDKLSLSILYFNIGEAYKTINQYQKAISFLQDSMKISNSIDDNIGVMWAKVTLADIYLIQQKPLLALPFYQHSKLMFEKSGDSRMHFQALVGEARSHLRIGQHKTAKALLDQAKRLLVELNSTLLKADYTEALTEYHSSLHHYDLAFLTQKELTSLNEEVFQFERNQDTQKFRVQFDAEMTESRNKILLKDNELKNLKIAKQQKEEDFAKVIISLGILVIIIFTLLLSVQIKHRNRFKDMALKDHLTNAPNRRAILKYAQERFNEGLVTNMDLSIGIIDLDKFKMINDTYGHDIGDEVLKSFAQACRTAFRKQDRFGRYGGEEWLVILSDTTKADLHIIFDRLYLQLNEKEIAGIPSDTKISFSMGVTQCDFASDKSLQAVINRADLNLYTAKKNGRNQLVI